MRSSLHYYTIVIRSIPWCNSIGWLLRAQSPRMSDCNEAADASQSGNGTTIQQRSEENLRMDRKSMWIVTATMLAIAAVNGVAFPGRTSTHGREGKELRLPPL
jgi:hypothetical protein